MTLESLFLVVSAFAVVLATQVQLCKTHISRLSGPLVIAFSLALGVVEGAVLGYLGVQGLDGFEAVHPAISGAVIGLLAGVSASGAKDLATGVGVNFAKAQARATVATPNLQQPQQPQREPEGEWQEVGLEALVE